MKKIESNPDKTILVITVGFLIIYVVAEWEWAMIVALAVGLIGVFSPFLSQKIEWLWMKLAYVLSLIVPNILLTIIFFLLLSPIAWLAKLFGEKDPLFLKNTRTSTFRDRKGDFDKAYFEKTW